MIIGNSQNKKFLGFAISTKGYTHKDGICQDSSEFFANQKMAILAVCDGHGHDNYFRSNVGSKIAARIGVEAIKEFVLTHPKFSSLEEKEIESTIKQLKEFIIFKWNEETYKNFKDYPLSIEELSKLKDKDRDEYLSTLNVTNYRKIYGTTFIAGVITSSYWLILQIGDGEATLLDQRGLYLPMPEDSHSIFQYTSSLCEEDAILNFRHVYGFNSPVAMILSTDGLRKSFTEEKYFLNLYKDILNDAKVEDLEKLRIGLVEDFPVLSQKGSGDDISFALAFNKEKLDEYKL